MAELGLIYKKLKARLKRNDYSQLPINWVLNFRNRLVNY